VQQRSYNLAARDALLRALTRTDPVDVLPGVLAGRRVEHVLDVGCGVGKGLLPYVRGGKAVGVGVDVSAIGLDMGKDCYSSHLPDAKVMFMLAQAEALPLRAEYFDVIICALVLPYTDNALALGEMARVLRSDGLLFLKVQHARYYHRKFWRALATLKFSSVLHAGRALVAGSIYAVTGRQPKSHLLSECFQTRWLLRRELAKHGLAIEREQPGSNPYAPSYVIARRHGAGRPSPGLFSTESRP